MAEDTYNALVAAQTELTDADRLLVGGNRRQAYEAFEETAEALSDIYRFKYCREAGPLANKLRADVISKLTLSLLDGGAACWQPQRDRIKARSAALVSELGALVQKYATPE